MHKDDSDRKTMSRLRKDTLRMSGRLPDLRPKPLRLQEEGEGQARRREGADNSAYGKHHVLASGRNSYFCTAVHGITVRQTAGVLQERGPAARTVERPRHEEDAPEGNRQQG